ncbi:MAG: hypothetical protein MdMp014T_0444 [Treponematales bacterium]
MINFSEKFQFLRKHFGVTTAGLEKILNLSNGYIANIEKKGIDNPGKLLLALNGQGVSIDWFLTGQGEMFLSPVPVAAQSEGGKSEIDFGFGHNQASPKVPLLRQKVSCGEGANAQAPAHLGGEAGGEPEAGGEGEGGKAVRHFEIPLLTKKEAELYNPAKEIPFGKIKANSGDYPDISTVPIPWRALEYSTDLRAIEVFDSRMFPVFKSGDIVVFEATGWNGNGIYLYRMSGGLHISYAGRLEEGFVLLNEIDKPIVYDAATFVPLGRVRAVVKDMLGADWKGGAMPPSGG